MLGDNSEGVLPPRMDQSGSTSFPMVVVTGVSKPAICNGLLCSIMKALSRNASKKELASVIARDCSEDVVKEAWILLFSFFSEAEDRSQKKKIISITRESKLKMVEDILTQLDHVSRNQPDAVLLVMPWDYTMKEFESEN